MKIAAIAFTEQGAQLGERLKSGFSEFSLTRCQEGVLRAWTEEHFYSCDALLFIGAAGIAVRAIAPFVKDKTTDPAVIVMDELGSYAIPILSGHLGGANELAGVLCRQIDAMPVITTATDINGVFAIDTWAKRQGLFIANPGRVKWISARLLCGKSIYIKSMFSIKGAFPQNVLPDQEGYDVLVTHCTRGMADALRLIAPCVTLGIGCKKGVAVKTIEAAFELTLKKASCHPLAVCGVASIDLKKDEPGLLEFCTRRNLPLKTFSAQELMRAEGQFSSSAFVQKTTGADNVCERAAALASSGRLLAKKEAGNGVTMALAIKEPVLCFGEECE